MALQTKAAIISLINGYIADGSPNIKAEEHREIETSILDRVDARILYTGNFLLANLPSGQYRQVPIIFTPAVYTSNYLVTLTYAQNLSYAHSISNRTTTGFTITFYNRRQSTNVMVWYTVFNKETL